MGRFASSSLSLIAVSLIESPLAIPPATNESSFPGSLDLCNARLLIRSSDFSLLVFGHF